MSSTERQRRQQILKGEKENAPGLKVGKPPGAIENKMSINRIAQKRFNFKRASSTTFRQRQSQYDANNIEAAHVILENPTKYAGFPVLWAQMLLQRFGLLHVEADRAA